MNEADLYSWQFYDSPIGKRLRGIIKNDKTSRWPDGRRVFTSPIVSMAGLTVRTENTVYHLKTEWEGPWTLRDLDGHMVVEDGEVHFDNVRNGVRIG